MPKYVPPAQRHPASQYRDMLRTIRDEGVVAPTKQGVDALTFWGYQMRFPMAQGAPVITERSMAGFYRKAIGELCAFVNGARTVDQLAEYGCDWWGPWATADKCASRGLAAGDLGPGSYGHAFRNHTTNLDDDSDPGFDQFDHLIRKLRDLPTDRTAMIDPWIPKANHREAGVKSRNTIAPCHGWIHARILDNKLYLNHDQRSGDAPVGVPSNMAQYAALGLMIEHLTGYELELFTYNIHDAHIYLDQLDAVDEMLSRPSRPLPTLQLNSEGRQIADVHDFRAHHFDLVDYDPHPAITTIPVTT